MSIGQSLDVLDVLDVLDGLEDDVLVEPE